jgi:hypothetical protein
MKLLLAVAALCALVVGCVGPKQKEYPRAHFGPYPTNYHDVIMVWAERNFDTPRNIFISTPVRSRVPNKLLNTNGKIYGWRSGVSLEEKDAFDQYGARKIFHVYLRAGEIVTASVKTTEQMPGIAQSSR